MRLSAGTRLGPYEIVAPLGAGGMGEVYRARDPRLGREVALKVLPAHLSADPGRRARFEREARAASSLNHPHICTLYDIGQQDGTDYIVMEYVDGQTLADRLRKGALAVDEALERGIEIAQALEHAHRSGVIHRDLKPANVMVQADGRTKILDFGLAKLREGGAEGEASAVSKLETRDAELTGEGSLVGTAAYMSPEQAKGSRLDPRSDLFSLGVILYEMATARNPFRGPTAVETLGAILKDRPPPASEVNAEVPVEISRLIDRLLAKEPSERPASASVVLDELATARRSLERGPRGHSIAVLPFANMSADPEQEYFCEGMAEELINALTKVEGLRVAARTSAFQFKGKAENVKRIGEELGVATVLEGSVRKSGNRLRVTAQLVNAKDGYHLWSERYDRLIEDVFALQDEITGSIIEALKPKLGIGRPAPRVRRHTEKMEAYHLYLKGRHFWFSRYEAGLQKALACFEQAIEQDPGYALAYAGVANAYAVLALYGFLPPEAARPRIRTAAEKAIALDDALPQAHVALGASRLGDWDWVGAERAYDRALELDVSHVLAHGWRGTLLVFLGRTEEGIAGARRAQELDPLSPFAHAIVGHCLRFARRHDEAVEACRNALEFDPSFLFALYVLGLARCHRSEHEEGVAILERAAALSGRAAWYVSLLGWAYASAGRRSEAEEVLRELEQRSQREYIAPLFVAAVFAGLGEKDRAFECLERAYATQVPWLTGLKVEPIWDGLRPDPRFHDLLRRLRLAS